MTELAPATVLSNLPFVDADEKDRINGTIHSSNRCRIDDVIRDV